MSYSILVQVEGEPQAELHRYETVEEAREALLRKLTHYVQKLEARLGASHEDVWLAQAAVEAVGFEESATLAQGYQVDMPASDSSGEPATSFQILVHE